MDSSVLLILFIAVFFFVVGAVVVAIIYYFRRVTHKAKMMSKVIAKPDPNLGPIAHLMRDLTDQELVVEMDGKYFKTFQELSPAQQRRLTFTYNVLTRWLVQPPPEPASDQAELPAALSLEALPQPDDWIPAEALPEQSKGHHVPPFADESEPEVKPVSTNFPDIVTTILNPTPTPPTMFKSIANQINDILQARISGTPFESRGITVSDSSDYGVVFTLDGIKYQGVKEMPDESVRGLIRSVVMEWEKTSKSAPKQGET